MRLTEFSTREDLLKSLARGPLPLPLPLQAQVERAVEGERYTRAERERSGSRAGSR